MILFEVDSKSTYFEFRTNKISLKRTITVRPQMAWRGTISDITVRPRREPLHPHLCWMSVQQTVEPSGTTIPGMGYLGRFP